MKSLNRECTITSHNLLMFISHLSLGGYSNQYLCSLVSHFKHHPTCPADSENILNNILVLSALKSAVVVSDEDNRIPLNHMLLNQMCTVFDRDFLIYNAILLKSMVWLGTCCMLQISELTGLEFNSSLDHAVHYKDIITIQNTIEKGISLTLYSWKGNKKGKTLYFPIPSYFEDMFHWLTR